MNRRHGKVGKSPTVSLFRQQKDLGLKEGKEEIARKMKNRGAPLDQIVGDTGLSVDEIMKL